jgi:hypothetical protein
VWRMSPIGPKVLHNEQLWSLQPLLRAYALSYAASTGPRLLSYLTTIRRRDLTVQQKLQLLLVILKTSAQLNRFPTACTILVAGPTLATRLLLSLIRRLLESTGRIRARLGDLTNVQRVRFVSTFLCAWLAFNLLNRDKDWSRKRARSRGALDLHTNTLHGPNRHRLPSPGYRPKFAGKTIDFTLFAFTRALDITAITAWRRWRSSARHPEHRAPRLSSFAIQFMDPWIFASSASIIMWAWFYSPERLPRAYNRWISRAADIDQRLITALRRCREGEFVYGKETGQAPLLTSLCNELGMPPEWGDPVKTVPIPCELYHCARVGCETHGLSRFVNSFKFAMELYLPLQLLTKVRTPNRAAVMSALKSAIRSSSFLAAFVALFYYTVCLARTRLGPRIFSKATVSPQMWDSGLCMLAGCMACGWSILIEKPSRRQEIAFFVAPRALATLLPRVYDKAYQRREQIAFACSMAIVLTTAKSTSSDRIRGVLGRVLKNVLAE